MSPSVVRRLGRYRVDELIGTGSFASVYRAFDERLESTVVVKLLGDNHGLNAEVRERFIGEARALRKIRNPHVIEAYDIGETERHQPFLVLEYADRGTLADRTAALRAASIPVTVEGLTAVARSLGEAVAAVHEASIVHRDLSPSNVLLRSVPVLTPQLGPPGRGAIADAEPASIIGSDERLLVADLGMCKDLAINSGLTAAGGTDGFRPPEQRGCPALIDRRADLWALSALLLWIVSGRHPPDVDPAEAVVDGGMPRGLGVALARSLADQPADRHADIDDWLTEVLASLEPASLPRVTPGANDEAQVRLYAGRSRKVAVASVLLVAGIATGIGATNLVGRDGAAATEIRDLGAGNVEVSTSVDGAELALSGPDTIQVGELATFVADPDGADEWVWFTPDGRILVNADDVTIRATSPGTATLSLRTQSPDGSALEVTHTVAVVEAG